MEAPVELKTQKCYPQVDYLDPEINGIIISNGSDFLREIQRIHTLYMNQDYRSYRTVPMFLWVRDYISSKTSKEAFVRNLEMKIKPSIEHSEDLIKKNNRITHLLNSHSPFQQHQFPAFINNLQPTEEILEGGNTFHAFIPEGESLKGKGKFCVVIGEVGLNSQVSIDKKRAIPVRYAKVGKNSVERYSSDPDAKLAQNRQSSKQTLKLQFEDHETSTPVIIVPNAYSIHIDMEMCILPNGVVLLQSFTETRKFIEKHKDYFSEICKWDEFHANIVKHCETSQKLLDITKTKLEKAGFKVMSVCGFIPNSTNTKLLAFGFNGITMLISDKIIYTLADNHPFFYDYFSKKLQKVGVSIVHRCQLGVDFVNMHSGFFRCQTNTLPKAMLGMSRIQVKAEPALSEAKKNNRSQLITEINALFEPCINSEFSFFKGARTLGSAEATRSQTTIIEYLTDGKILSAFVFIQKEYNNYKKNNEFDFFCNRLIATSEKLAKNYPLIHNMAEPLCTYLEEQPDLVMDIACKTQQMIFDNFECRDIKETHALINDFLFELEEHPENKSNTRGFFKNFSDIYRTFQANNLYTDDVANIINLLH